MWLLVALIWIRCASVARALSLLDAISVYPELSNFTVFYQNNLEIATLLLTNSSTEHRTLLIPNNEAFTNFELQYGVSIWSMATVELQALLEYHILVGEMTSANFSQQSGIAVPSLLTGEKYDNRSAGPDLSTSFGNTQHVNGQVVFISPAGSSSSRKLFIRQSGTSSFRIQSGLGAQADLISLDGVWDGGMFQEVSQFLTLPAPCSTTIRTTGLSSLDGAINRTDLWDDLDRSSNYTCLAPSDQAFADAGNPQTTLNESALGTSMRMHTIPQSLYTNFLVDGQIISSDDNLPIRVSIKGTDIYFNDAKVTNSNIITNNGVIHVLDKVMSPLQDLSTSSPTISPTATSTGARGAATSNSAARASVPLSPRLKALSLFGFVLAFFI
ncbi:FAS1 domain-containing protein [Glonium stellatum]|uniref:FAS1 domain-containing protein n=1 Tax=Glonium stellatum TaxID=574774 RepID=A0A8E2F8K1_9PEZI|nr:FAS1 domain-containing protein [Glonium stellatum]